MIYCTNCIWTDGCLDLDDPNFPNQQVEKCEKYIDYRELKNNKI